MTVRTKKLGLGSLIAAVICVAILPLWRAWAEETAPKEKKPAKKVVWNPGPDQARYLTFLQTDKPIYRGGETVYVRGVVLHHSKRTALADAHRGLLKVIGPKGDVVASNQVVIDSGSWGSQWVVPDDMAGGEFNLQVSYPQAGLPPAERKFDVRAYRAPRLKSQIKFVRDGYGPGDEVAATLEVERAEGGIPVNAPVVVTARVDGVQVHEGRATVGIDGRCRVKFTLPKSIQRGEGTLALAIQDGGVVETAAKTIPILLQNVDITMYPEGGDLITGLPSRVYFEAFTPAGKPADLAGRVVNDEGEMVAEFRSEHEGRGRFEITPKPSRSYHLEFTEPAGITQQVDLPKAVESGITLRSHHDVHEQGQAIALTVGSTEKDEIKVVVRQRERIIASKTVAVKAGKTKKVSINIGDQPHADGVLIATAYDGQDVARAERLVMRRPAHEVHVKITPESGTGFVPGGTVRLKVETTNGNGKPIAAVVGLTVTDESVLEMIEKREQAPRLPVMVLLENEVKDLADAHVYLDPENEDAPRAIDLLLGVQGWRRFALVDPNQWLSEHKDAGRRALAFPVMIMASFDRSARFGGGGFEQEELRLLRGALPAGAIPVPPAPVAAVPADDPVDLAAAPVAKGDGKDGNADLKLVDAKLDVAKAEQKEKLDGEPGEAGGKRANKPRAAQQQDQDGQAQPGDEGEGKFKQRAGNRDRLEAARELIIGGPEADDMAELPAGRRRQLQQLGAAQRANAFVIPLAKDLQSMVAAPLVSVRVYQHQVRANRQPGERVDFTETLYWNAGLKTDDKGIATIEFGLSDAVTAFRVNADVFDGRGALGEGQTTVESVEPFYLEPKLPLEVTMGDLIQTPLGIVNATGQSMDAVKVTVETEGLNGDATLQPFVLDANGRLRKRVNIHVGDFVGNAQFKVTALGGKYQDQVTRNVRVMPLGFPHEDGSGALLPADGIVALQVVIPDDVVPGSIRASAALYPTPLATMTASLERLIREPYGCFEQTSSTTYPLVMAQQYFMSHQDVDPALVSRGAGILAKGYDRLIGFESPSGGFEWFGKDPGHDALTAYGLLEFTDMSQVHTVDSAMLQRTRDWLMKQRDGKGGYVRKTHTLHTWLAEPEVASSYNTWALLEAGVSPIDLKAEVKWVGAAAEQTANSYVIALGANVAQLGDEKDTSKRLLDKLSGLQAPDGSVAGGVVSVVGSGGQALKIETTALALLAWLKDGNHTPQVEQGIKYLAEVCEGGRFGSTQSTVLALRGIVAYDQTRAKPKEDGTVSVWVDGKQVGDVVAFDAESHGEIKLPDFATALKAGKHQVELRMDDGSEMPCTITYGYNSLQPDSSSECKLDLEVSIADTVIQEGATTDMEVVVVNRSEEKVPTPTAIIGIPGGLEVRHDKLKELVKEELIAAYEVRGREVILYWRVLDGEQRVRVSLNVVAAVPGSYTAPASRAYLYYTDEHKDWDPGVNVSIRPAKQ